MLYGGERLGGTEAEAERRRRRTLVSGNGGHLFDLEVVEVAAHPVDDVPARPAPGNLAVVGAPGDVGHPADDVGDRRQTAIAVAAGTVGAPIDTAAAWAAGVQGRLEVVPEVACGVVGGGRGRGAVDGLAVEHVAVAGQGAQLIGADDDTGAGGLEQREEAAAPEAADGGQLGEAAAAMQQSLEAVVELARVAHAARVVADLGRRARRPGHRFQDDVFLQVERERTKGGARPVGGEVEGEGGGGRGEEGARGGSEAGEAREERGGVNGTGEPERDGPSSVR